MKTSALALAPCTFCGRLFEMSRSQSARKGNKYCSSTCLSGMSAGLSAPELPEWAITILDECRKRAKRKGIEYSITDRDMRAIVKRSGWRCELSGIPFEFEKSRRRGPHRPFSPSLDRIDSGRGYTPENVRLVCLAVNIAMNTWGADVLVRIATGIVGSASETDGYIPKNRRKTGLLPGVYVVSTSRNGTRYGAKYRNKWIGYFDSETDAHIAYKRRRALEKSVAKAAMSAQTDAN